MKAIKIIVAILIPLAILCGIAPFVLDILCLGEGVELQQILDLYKSLFENFTSFIENGKETAILFLASMGLGCIIFILWIVLGCIRKHFSRIGAAFVADIFLSINALAFVLTYACRNLDGNEKVGLADLAFYIGIGCIALFFIGFVLDVIRMFVMPKKHKSVQIEDEEEDEYSYNDIPPVLSEKRVVYNELPRALNHDSNHVEVTPNRYINHAYLTESEIAALVANMKDSTEPEINLDEYANILGKSEPKVEEMPAILDPNFVAPKDEEEPIDLPAILDPNFVAPEKDDIPHLPMFGEQPVEEEINVMPVTSAPAVQEMKKSGGKPLHVSKNKNGKYQVKQVGDNKPLAMLETEEEAILYARQISYETGASIRLHDSEGKIHSI